MSVLSKYEIRQLIEQPLPLIEGYINLEEQLQPNGIDLTLRNVSGFTTTGHIPVDNNRRLISELKQFEYDNNGMLELKSGCYLITLNEIVNLPKNIMALAKPRSSLLRCGVAIHNAVWDAGYSGRSQCLMVVYNLKGFYIQKDVRINQLVFFRLDDDTEAYRGKYQNENI